VNNFGAGPPASVRQDTTRSTPSLGTAPQPSNSPEPAAPQEVAVRLCTLARGPEKEFRAELSSWKGTRFVGLRQWNKALDGKSWHPDPKRGCSIRLSELDEMIEALAKARQIVQQGGQP
jgi:hypothetical protein